MSPFQEGVIYLSIPDNSSAFILLAELALRQIEVHTLDEVLCFPCFPDAFSVISEWWSGIRLSDITSEPQYTLLPHGKRFTLSHASRMRPVGDLIREVANSWIHEIVRERRVMTCFQPIVEANHPEVPFAHECLVRGLGANGEVVPPDRLFEVARSSGLLAQADRIARLQAVRNFGMSGAIGKAFVNINPAVACGTDLASTSAAVRAAGLTPDQVVFEIVESDEVRDERALVRITENFRRHGFGIALDDFGAGYSGMHFLLAIRPDYVKLDKKLVQGIEADPYRQRMAEQLLALARRLGARSVVEGIERPEELAFVKSVGADLVQGYLFGRPQRQPVLPKVAEAS